MQQLRQGLYLNRKEHTEKLQLSVKASYCCYDLQNWPRSLKLEWRCKPSGSYCHREKVTGFTETVSEKGSTLKCCCCSWKKTCIRHFGEKWNFTTTGFPAQIFRFSLYMLFAGKTVKMQERKPLKKCHMLFLSKSFIGCYFGIPHINPHKMISSGHWFIFM